MAIIDSLRERLVRLLTAPKQELGSWAQLLRFQIQLWRFCARRLRRNNAAAMSAALSFRTIFALVPTLVIVLLMLKPLGLIEDNKRIVRDFLQASGLAQITYAGESQTQPATMPASGGKGNQVDLAEKIESLIERVEGQLTIGALGPIGAVLLIWTALTLLTTMERCLNRVFEAPRSRPLGRRILLYWSAVTLAPLALLVASSVGEQASTATRDMPVLSWLVGMLGWAGPVVVGMVILAALYKHLPNQHVRFRSALAGAVVAFPIWLVARWAFALYVERVGKQSIYGAIGVVPLFLMWLNASWWVFLFGAQLAHVAANLRRMQSPEPSDTYVFGAWDLLAAVTVIARGNVVNRGPVTIKQLAGALNLSEKKAEVLLDRMTDDGLVCRIADDEDSAYLLAKPPDSIKVSDILQLNCGSADMVRRGWSPEVAKVVMDICSRSEAGLEGITVAEVLRD